MIYLRYLLILSLLISNNYLLAEDSDKPCFNLIKQNQCLQAIEACKVEAENNDPKAQTALGMLLSGIRHGDYRKNYKQSFFWVNQAAEQGYSKAQVVMAEMYMNGEVVPMSAKKAKVWYEKAAEQGNLDGVNGLARLYRYGTGVRKDYEKAFAYYQQAASDDHIRSQVGVGLSYRDAKGVKKNMVKAYAWLLIVSDKIDKQGMRAIQKEYELERDNLDKTIPNCKYLSRLEEASDIMTIGYAKKLLLDLKQRMSIKQINKAKKLAEDIKKERV